MLARIGSKNLARWVGGYLRQALGRRLAARHVPGTRHLLFAMCDHFEPLDVGVSRAASERRVRTWCEGYPELARGYLDADGRHPRHTFFFPLEQAAPNYLSALADLGRLGMSEVEVHLHHDKDTPAGLRAKLSAGTAELAAHGHLARHTNGNVRYAFIHGNWCLADARADGRGCGVPAELPLLFDSGCYADFTFPSAPDESQPGIVNSLYWPIGELTRRRAYESGVVAEVGTPRRDRLLMVQGPLALTSRSPGPGIRIENGVITSRDAATPARLRSWVGQQIHVRGRPEWTFLKVSTHGAAEAEAASLLGAGGRALHHALAEGYNDGVNWRLHYVTAREMFNIAMAAMDGRSGDPAEYVDYAMSPPPVAP